ncbi:hypothetical protein OIU78_004421 [Salix suchowensis]|nr:hypothetical protein OIU78_004421 [Salix suchowensis]
MAQTVGRNIAAPLLFLNLLMYTIALGFACWCTNKYIDGQTSHPSFGGNGATGFFLTFAILACVVGIVSKFAGGTHIRVWRSDSLAAAGSVSLVAWAITALASGFACKEINVGGYIQRLETEDGGGIYNHFDIYPAAVRPVASRWDV